MRLLFGDKTLIMGILNITPDSFYDGGQYFDKSKAIRRACQLADEGADIIDIGGESTRPGAVGISEQEEMDRVCPVIEALSERITLPISVDTCKAGVAQEALKRGATIVNDISGLNSDGAMADVIARYEAYAILMHMKGTPEHMQDNPVYINLREEIYQQLHGSVIKAQRAGIERNRIIIDPGIGFGKTMDDNYRIIDNIGYFKSMGHPLLIGLSRKSLIGRLFGENFDRLPATIALNAIAVYRGADIVRVHDVKAHRLALAAVDKLMGISIRNGSTI